MVPIPTFPPEVILILSTEFVSKIMSLAPVVLRVRVPALVKRGEVTEVEAERVVKAPVEGVVEPMAPGAAHVPLSKVEALIVPEPVKSREAPVPTTIAAWVLVPEVIPEKGTEVAGTVELQTGAVPAP